MRNTYDLCKKCAVDPKKWYTDGLRLKLYTEYKGSLIVLIFFTFCFVTKVLSIEQYGVFLQFQKLNAVENCFNGIIIKNKLKKRF